MPSIDWMNLPPYRVVTFLVRSSACAAVNPAGTVPV